jgi:hypothetical protein
LNFSIPELRLLSKEISVTSSLSSRVTQSTSSTCIRACFQRYDALPESILPSELLPRLLEPISNVKARSFWDLWSTKIEQIDLKECEKSAEFSRIEACCQGWKVSYKIIDVQQDPLQIFATTLALDPDEIMLQFRQSLRPSMNDWKLNFPITISHSLNKFMILRTAFCLRMVANTFQQQTEVDCCILETDFLGSRKENWDGSRSFFGLAYSYEVGFSANEDFVIFRDNDLLSSQCTIAAHRLSYKEKGVYQSCLLKCMSTCADDLQIVLHPHKNIAIVNSKNQPYLWRYDSSKYAIWNSETCEA